MTAAAIALIAGSSHLLQSLGIAPVSISNSPKVHYIVHSKWAEWMICVPLLVFALGHVSQVGHKYVFSAMFLMFFVIFLGYIAELTEDLRVQLCCFVVASVLHSFFMLCTFFLCFSFRKLRNFQVRTGSRMVLDQQMIQALGISTVVCWSMYPFVFALEMAGIISENAYLHSYPIFDLVSKGTFIALLNAVHAEGDFKRVSAQLNLLKSDNNYQFQFLRFIYHEIRNPFHTIMLGLNQLEEEDFDEERRELIVMLQKSASSMLETVNTAAELTQTQGCELNKVPFDLIQLIKDTTAVYSCSARAKCIQINTHISPRLPHSFLGDSEKVGKIADCLLSNAVKFSPENSHVEVFLKSVCESPGLFKIRF